MSKLTCIVDTSTLVAHIHEIKQWIYDGNSRLLIPLCVPDEIEELFKAAQTSKDAPKDNSPKRYIGKVARKDYPLFDINPWTAREFISRAQADSGVTGVTFQLPKEQFSQWKEEEEKAAQAELPPPGPPTSFAQALLRKLNIKEDQDAGVKAPSKPKLVARSAETKTPWKHHKIPTIPRKDIPESLRPVLSAALWRVHEFENNPLNPEVFVLLSDSASTQSVAERIQLPAKTFNQIQESLQKVIAEGDTRFKTGSLEKEFGTTNAEQERSESPKKTPDISSSSNGAEPLAEGANILEEAEISAELRRSKVPGTVENLSEAATESLKSGAKSLVPSDSHVAISEGTHETGPIVNGDNSGNQVIPTTSTAGEIEIDGGPSTRSNIKHLLSQGNLDQKTCKPGYTMEGPKTQRAPEADADSDEEVIVFKPRGNRTSLQSKGPSRPTTADSKAQPIQQPALQSNTTAKSPLTSKVSQVTKLESTLKPESPVFTPKNQYVQLENYAPSSLEPESQIQSTKQSTHENPRPRSQGRKSPPRQPRSQGQSRNANQDLIQKHSRDILQRQREAIQRQAQAKAQTQSPVQAQSPIASVQEAGDSPKSTPRQIHLEPTDHPTVIDPDDFGRSYIVSKPILNQNQKMEVNGSHHGRRGNGRGGRNGRNGTRSKSEQPTENESEFVLKSGSPRSSTRGRGKLWVP